jgi:hypothetical protein
VFYAGGFDACLGFVDARFDLEEELVSNGAGIGDEVSWEGGRRCN